MGIVNDLVKSIPIIPIGSKVIVLNREYTVIKILFDNKHMTPAYSIANSDECAWVLRDQITSVKGSKDNIKMVDDIIPNTNTPTPSTDMNVSEVENEFDIISYNRLSEDYIRLYGTPDTINGSNIETIDIVSYLTRDDKGRDVEKIIMTHIVGDIVNRYSFRDIYGKNDTIEEHAVNTLNRTYENIFKEGSDSGKALYIHKNARQYIASKLMVASKII